MFRLSAVAVNLASRFSGVYRFRRREDDGKKQVAGSAALTTQTAINANTQKAATPVALAA